MTAQNSGKISSSSEFAVIGLALKGSPEDFARVLALTTPEDFALPPTHIIRTELQNFSELEFDAGLLRSFLEAKGYLDTVVTVDVLQKLNELACLPIMLKEHVKQLKLMRAARNAEQTNIIMAERLGSEPITDSTLPALINQAVEDLQAALQDSTVSKCKTLGEVFAKESDDEDEDGKFLPTGLEGLDNILTGDGLMLGSFTIVAARPGMGKTTLGLDITRNLTMQYNRPVMIVSLEMSAEELAARFVAASANVSSSAILAKNFNSQEAQRIGVAQQEMKDLPLFIFDDNDITRSGLKALFEETNTWAKSVYGEGIQLVVVDYIQLMQPDKSKANISREREVALLSRDLKNLAQSKKIATIGISQLNRDSDVFNPSLNDLRESGAIEQDADNVFIIALDSSNESPNARGPMNIHVLKQRHGPTGVAPVTMMSHLPVFVDREVEDESLSEEEIWGGALGVPSDDFSEEDSAW